MFQIIALVVGIFAAYGLWTLLLHALPQWFSMVLVIAILGGWIYALYKGSK